MSEKPKPGAVCPTCERIRPPTVQDHDCDDMCQEEEHRAIRCMLQIVPEPGEECPLCREKTPNKHALEVRAWRAKSKAPQGRDPAHGTRGTERKELEEKVKRGFARRMGEALAEEKR